MIDLGIVFAVARAEARLTRRLVRYWVFVVLAAIIGLGGYAYYAGLHWYFSSYSATAAMINPRYLVGVIGVYYLMIFVFGLVFLGYDVRARDARERMAEVLDARPGSNLDLLLGKFLGILVPCWIPVAIVCLVIGLAGRAFGEPVEPLSLVAFSVAMALPAFTFAVGLVFLLTLILRHRGLAAVVLFAAVLGLYWASFGLPIYLTPLVDVMGAYSVVFPSDIVPGIVALDGLIQRSGVLLAGLGLIVLAAVVHPRLDDAPRKTRAAVGALLVVLGIGMCGAVTLQRKTALARAAAWHEAHIARKTEPAPDITAIGGKVRIVPGRELVLDLDLRFRAPTGQRLATALFSLNPGISVTGVKDAAGAELAFEAANGLVDVRLSAPLEPGQETSVALAAHGRPDSAFAYLDSVIDPNRISPYEGQLLILGYEPFLLDRRYVALMPGARWMPGSGAEAGRGDPGIRPQDLFDLDLTVEVPEGWLLAGPGRRLPHTGATDAGWQAFRFAPGKPLPDFALVAGRFESRSAEVGGVEVEILVQRSHRASVEFFEDATDELQKWLGERLDEARAMGLAYPYGALTLVESPTVLRGYGGGWRMDTTLAQPAMLLVRESSFPTARFDRRFKNPDTFRDKEGGIGRAKREMLEKFFENDFSGGNPFVGAARSFFIYQTAAAGDEGLPLEYVCEDLTTRLVTEKQGYFSAHIYNKDMNDTIGSAIGAFMSSRGQNASFSDAVIAAATSRADVWDAVLGVSLSALEPWNEPKRAIDVLTLKGGAMARSMMDALGHDKTARVLAELRERNAGGSFTRADLIEAGRTVGEDLTPWVDLWIEQTDLPGFTAEKARVERLQDSGDGSPRYQLLLELTNGENVPGLVRLEYLTGDNENRRWDQSEPVRLDGRSTVEVGLVTPTVPREVLVAPYLSLNRGAFAIPLPAVDEEKVVAREPFVGTRVVAWKPSDAGAVIVDDLDPGFGIEGEEKKSRWRFGSGSGAAKDQGLPVAQNPLWRPPGVWSRATEADAWGRYRHTAVVVQAGDGRRRAVFTATIPRAGRWRLECHLPPQWTQSGEDGPRGRRVGNWHFTLADGSGEREVPFAAAAAEAGWNELGTFDLPAGEVRLGLSDKTDGSLVFADAIRWNPETAGEVARIGP